MILLNQHSTHGCMAPSFILPPKSDLPRSLLHSPHTQERRYPTVSNSSDNPGPIPRGSDRIGWKATIDFFSRVSWSLSPVTPSLTSAWASLSAALAHLPLWTPCHVHVRSASPPSLARLTLADPSPYSSQPSFLPSLNLHLYGKQHDKKKSRFAKQYSVQDIGLPQNTRQATLRLTYIHADAW